MDFSQVPVSAIMTAWRRPKDLLDSLSVIFQTDPLPAEVLVHLDAGSSITPSMVTEAFPGVKVLTSDIPVGPGGGRTKLIKAATNELVASFDDDSFPDHLDFFAEVNQAAARHPNVAVFAATILENKQLAVDGRPAEEQTFDFVGCGCVYRRSIFLKTSGYVPLPIAYGMEEVDLALRFHAEGVLLLWVPSLRVRHWVNLARYERPDVTAASIANIGLLAFLRYPWTLWPLGLFQCIRRAVWLSGQGRISGILQGFMSIPVHVWQHRNSRETLGFWQVLSFFKQRHRASRSLPTPFSQ